MSAKKYYLIGLLFLLCVLGACKKKNRNIPISADLKKFFSYKPGTYWIYKDSVNGQIDSFAVLSNTFGTASSTYEVADQETDNIAVFKKNVLFDSIYCKWTLAKDAVGFVFSTYYLSINYPLFIYPFEQGYNSNNGMVVNNVFASFPLMEEHLTQLLKSVKQDIVKRPVVLTITETHTILTLMLG